MQKLRDAINRAQTKITAARKRYKYDFMKKVRLRLVIVAGDSLYVDTPPRTLNSVERRKHERDTTDAGFASVKLIPKTESPFRVRTDTDSFVVIDQVGVSHRVSIERVTKMPREPVALAPTTNTDATAAAPQGEVEYVIE